MNTLVYNYKAKIVNIYNANTIDFSVNLGFRIERLMRIIVQGMDDIITPSNHTIAKNLIKEILTDRRVYIATTRPNLQGKTMCSVYIPVRKENILYDHLLCYYAGLQFISYTKLMTFASDHNFDIDIVKELLDVLEQYDA